VTLKIILPHALRHLKRYFVCVYELNSIKLTFFLISLTKTNKTDIQDDVIRDAK